MFTSEDFIRKGFFPEDLIPPFCSYTLANAYRRFNTATFSNTRFKKKSKCCYHSIPKIKNLRRHFSTPNPLHQVLLCETIGNNWNEINNHFKKSKISISVPTIKKDSTRNRSFDRSSEMKDLKYIDAERSFDSRYALIADISRYFPTIYTHTIPWALHGKQYAKEHIQDDTLLGNQLDRCVRNTQDAQTLGIPIGPDTSHILAEIIGTAIDLKLQEKIDTNVNGWRYVDDFHLFFQNRADVENALHSLHGILKEFELEINPQKTKILKLPLPLEQPWVTILRTYELRESKKGQKSDIINYFSKSFSFSKEFPDQSVLKYAIIKSRGDTIYPDNWELYESLLLKSIIAEPSCISIATKILYHYDYIGYNINKIKIGSVIDNLILYHSTFSHGHEISWALWLAKTLKIKINSVAESKISEFEDPIVALISLDLREEGLISQSINTSNWENYLRPSELYDSHWLLAYEACIKGWLPSSDGSDYISKDPFFSILQDSDVKFYDKMIHEIDYGGKLPKVEEYY